MISMHLLQTCFSKSNLARLVAAPGLLLTLTGATLWTTTQTRVPARNIGPREAEAKEVFSQVRGFRELSDGRVIVTDQIEKKIVLLDFARNTATRIGQLGDGPREYRSITDLYPLPGDTTMLVDVSRGLDALVTITPDAQLGEVVKLPGGVRVSYMFGVDGSGRIYSPASTITETGRVYPDSIPLLRVDLRRKKADTALFLRNNMRPPGGPPDPYNTRDQWAVARDGTIALVNVDDYHITWIAPDGKRRVAAPVPFERIRIVQQDKDEFRDLARRVTGLGVAGASSSGVQGAAPTVTFPDFKPPFFGNDAVRFAPNGELWVRRSQRAGEKQPLHDIIDASGKLVAKVTLPANTKLLLLGARGIYLARWDQDDLIHIERYGYAERR